MIVFPWLCEILVVQNLTKPVWVKMSHPFSTNWGTNELGIEPRTSVLVQHWFDRFTSNVCRMDFTASWRRIRAKTANPPSENCFEKEEGVGEGEIARVSLATVSPQAPRHCEKRRKRKICEKKKKLSVSFVYGSAVASRALSLSFSLLAPKKPKGVEKCFVQCRLIFLLELDNVDTYTKLLITMK